MGGSVPALIPSDRARASNADLHISAISDLKEMSAASFAARHENANRFDFNAK